MAEKEYGRGGHSVREFRKRQLEEAESRERQEYGLQEIIAGERVIFEDPRLRLLYPRRRKPRLDVVVVEERQVVAHQEEIKAEFALETATVKPEDAQVSDQPSDEDIATISDIRKRIQAQIIYYRELRRKNLLTPQWERFGARYNL